MSSSSESENISPWHSKPELRAPSPRRQPLHQRSDSDTNQRSGPTIRIVNDPDTTTYTKTPFPSHPSQILPPRNAHRGYAFEDQGAWPARVSDTSSATIVPSESSYAADSLVPKPLQLRKYNRTSSSTYNSDADTVIDGSPFTPTSVPRISQDTTPPASPGYPLDIRSGSLGIVEEEESSPTPASPPRSTIRKVLSSESGPSQPLHSQPSRVSIASSGSSDTLILHYSGEDPSDSSTSNLPLPPGPARQPRKPQYPNPRSKKRASSAQQTPKPILKKSSDSLASSDPSRTSRDRPRSSSEPLSIPHVAFAARPERASVVQYPSVRAPSATSSRASSSSRTLPKTLSRMTDRISRRPWNAQLSTISSVSERTSPTQSHGSENRPSSSRLAGAPQEEVTLEEATLSSTSLPRRTPSNVRPDDWRDSDEHHDVVAELQSPPVLKPQRSGYFSRFSSDSRPSSSRGSTDTRPSSSQSNLSNFVIKNIPGWARDYYRHGERAEGLTDDADSRRDSAHSTDETVSTNEPNSRHSVHRPRTRPRRRSEAQSDSLEISEASVPSQNWTVGPERSIIDERYSPRLQRDRRTGASLSAWRAPSLDEALGALSWSQGNRQVLFFCLGFIFPLFWLFAALLPIYPPEPFDEKAPRPNPGDIEAAMATHHANVDEIHYQKARWWRRLNRIMSVVGVAIIATIIALSILASRA